MIHRETRRVSCAFALTLVFMVSVSALAQAPVHIDSARSFAIDPERGTDATVDYASLVHLGPWDDRNYGLTAVDLALLADNEAELQAPIPVFFRVLFRKNRPDLPRTGPAQYPRSALNEFRLNYGGYLVDGTTFTGTTFEAGRYYIDTNSAVTEPESATGADFVSGEVRVTSPTGAAESAIKISPVDTNLVVAGSNGPSGGQKMHWSDDGGETWTQVSLPLGSTCCDPAVDWSSDGRYAYTTALGQCFFGCGVWFYRSDDNGQSWDSLSDINGDPRREIATGGGDKEFLHVDKFAGSPFLDNLYVTWHDGNVMQFARSSDFGNTWQTQVFSSTSENRGIGSDITTGKDGAVYYLWAAINSRTIRFAKSTDGGISFGPIQVIASTEDGFDFPIPAMESRRVFIYAAADTDFSDGPFGGSIYTAWSDAYGPQQSNPADNHARVQVAYSRDGGATWSISTPHEIPDGGVPTPDTPDRFHPWIGVGPDGTVYVAYYDTGEDGDRTTVDFYWTKSEDGGETWDPPQDLTSVTSPNIADSFELGDYNGLDVVMNDLITIFTDNRDESGGTAESVDVYAAGLVAGTPRICGNGILEPGEPCDGDNLGNRTCSRVGCDAGVLTCLPDCSGFDTSQCTGCPQCGDGVCDLGENCSTCPDDCISQSAAECGNGKCETADGEDCLTCEADCAGVQNGKPTNRYCCGTGGGENPVDCSDPRCTGGGLTCSTVVDLEYCCGDLTCNAIGEDLGNCPADCTPPTPGASGQVTLGYDRASDAITVNFGTACSATGHAIAYGELDRVAMESYDWSGRTCGVGTTGSYAWDQAGTPSSTFFVLLGTTDANEGSYGLDSNGFERPEDEVTPATCQQAQDLAFRCD